MLKVSQSGVRLLSLSLLLSNTFHPHIDLADSVKAAVAESSDQESHIPLSDILRDWRLNMAALN